MPKGKPAPPTAPPTAAKELNKPSLRVDLPMDEKLPKVGSTVRIEVSGKVISSGAEIQRYNDNKKRAHVEIEYDAGSAKVEARGKRSMKEIEDADERV